jgi:hypothetical protein
MEGLTQSKKRTILVYNQPKQKVDQFETESNKWADVVELIKASKELDVRDINSMRAVVSSTQVTLELPNAEIPDGDQKIFLFEAKVKSGAKVREVSVYSTMSFTDLRRLAKDKGVAGSLGSNPKKDDLIKALERAAGVKRDKVTKVSAKTGKSRSTIVTTRATDSDKRMRADVDLVKQLENQDARIQSLEGAFAKLITGLHETSADFIKPAKKVEPILKGKLSKADLSKLDSEAKKLTV